MKISTQTAREAILFSCYIDLETGKLIYPRWYAHDCSEDGLWYTDEEYTDEEYDVIESDRKRYLKVPAMDNLALTYLSAIEIGISQELLLAHGIRKYDYSDLFIPLQEEDGKYIEYEISDEDAEISHRFNKYLRKNGLSWKHSDMAIKIKVKAATEWFGRHGIELFEEEVDWDALLKGKLLDQPMEIEELLALKNVDDKIL